MCVHARNLHTNFVQATYISQLVSLPLLAKPVETSFKGQVSRDHCSHMVERPAQD